MSNVLALAMKVTADASQLSQSLTPVERALKKLGDEATKSASLFDQFAASSSAAAQAQTSVQQQFAALDKALQDGTINAKEYSEQFKAIQDGAKALASSFAEGQRVTEKFASDQERAAAETKRLDDLLKKGAISQATYNRAIQSLGEEAQKTDPALQQLAASVRAISAIQIGRAIIDVFQGIAGVVSGAVRSIAQWTSRITASVDATDKLAKRTGVAVEQLQALSVAAGLAGVDSQTLGTSIERLNASIGKAEAGGGLDRTFKRLGTSLQDLRRLAPEDQFKTIADSIGRIPNPSERAAAAVQVFGRSGQQLLPLFRDGAKSIDEIAKRAERLGIVLGADQVSNITNLNDSFSLVRQTIDGIIGQVIGDLAPAVSSVAEEFLKFVEEFNEGGQVEGGRAIAQAITDGIIVGVRAFLEAIRSFDGVTSRLLASLSQIPGLDIRTDQQRNVDELELAIKTNLNLRDPISRLVFGIDKAALDLDLADLQRALAVAKSQSGTSGLAAAEEFINQFEQKLAQTRSPQFKIETNIQRTRDEFDSFFAGVVDDGSELAAAMQEFEEAVSAAKDPTQFTAEEIEKIRASQEKVNALLRSGNADRAEALALAEKQAAEDAKLVDAFVKQQFGDPSADERVKAAETLAAVTRQIEAVEAEIAQARAGNDKLAEESATRRLAILDQAKTAAQEQVEFGFTSSDADAAIEQLRGKLDEVFTFDNFTIAPEAFKEFQAGIDELDQQLRDKVIDPETYREAAGLLLQGFQDSVKEAEKLQDLQLSYAERVAQIDAERLEALSRASQEPLKVEDIRTSGGIAEFLRLATGREDPAIDEARKQTRELERLRAEIVRLGGQVEIIGAG
jgi:hypothetical protein